ncbi:hypothetical protein GCM10017620_18890 [Brevundimonas intermedia]|jgi:AraC family transcriptional regulator|uniref:HTH araC/xylS-type domain-containing protein n=1 Tax=Brevundimonas intermedia TaxID=74315 RepID=A0ABQ5T967_9CAUL|nr:AraC family transcriptional regulator [Brevundimonas intermedia]GLK48916.1 hypothetical protein GCM10017620_18890 [Brevundimonas intermedia]
MPALATIPDSDMGAPSLENLGPMAFRILAQVDGALDRNAEAARQGLNQLQALLRGLPVWSGEAYDRSREPRREAEPTRGGLAPWQMKRIAAFVDDSLDDRIQVEDLASQVRLSASHFCRAFKVTTGETPHAYVMRRRLEKAKALMLNTDESLCRIADACGLADQAHLTRLFRRHLDTTPFQWRRDRRVAA